MPSEAPLERPTKVAVLVGALEVGGAELDIVRNFPRLNRDEFDVVVVSFGTKGMLGPELERQGIRVVAREAHPPTRRGPMARAWRYVAVTTWVARTFAEQRVDIAHFFLPHAYAYGMFACLLRRRSARTVMSRLSLNFYRDSHRVLAWFERNTLHRRVDIAIANSQPILEELAAEGVPSAKLRLLHNGIDPALFQRVGGERERAREALGFERDAFVLVAVGNLHTYKGHGDLIEACAQVRDVLPEGWQLAIAGRDEGGNRARYEALVQRLGIEKRVRMLGPVEEVAQLLFAADVFVHPSHHEGLPNAVLEAMAASLPVIGTRVGGIPEAVRAGTGSAVPSEQTGWLVAPGDVEALSAAMLDAASDAGQRVRMGGAGRARIVAEFSLDRSVSAYEAIYRELVSG